MRNESRPKLRIFALIAALAIPLLVGGFSALLTAEDVKLYGAMNHPPLAPPGWAFPIVWTLLYAMMGVASYLVSGPEVDPERKAKALRFYGAQLIMNFFWCMLFFTYSRYLISLIWLLVMWVLILICAVCFGRIRRAAGWMMGILFVWTTFAAYLNLATLIMSMKPMPINA